MDLSGASDSWVAITSKMQHFLWLKPTKFSKTKCQPWFIWNIWRRYSSLPEPPARPSVSGYRCRCNLVCCSTFSCKTCFWPAGRTQIQLCSDIIPVSFRNKRKDNTFLVYPFLLNINNLKLVLEKAFHPVILFWPKLIICQIYFLLKQFA